MAQRGAAQSAQQRAQGVTDEIWEEVNAHFTEEIGAINTANNLHRENLSQSNRITPTE
ncbi:hypothetical protein ACWGLP_12025 [Streptomyces lydicus]|uniref:hypothetical protein n=1 Tax=Streptomyces lydicus TaxID=47763 RepID=UPI0037CF7F95